MLERFDEHLVGEPGNQFYALVQGSGGRFMLYAHHQQTVEELQRQLQAYLDIRIDHERQSRMYADAQATIADLQGQVEAAQNKQTALEKSVRNLTEFYDKYNGTPCEQIRHQQEVEQLQQRVAQLEGDKSTLRLGLNALRDSYDELESRHSDLRADHASCARVLGLVQAAREYIATIPARLHPDHSEEWKDGYHSAVYDVDQFLTGKRTASLPAQRAQGGA